MRTTARDAALQQNVVRLQVAMDDRVRPDRVQVLQPVQNVPWTTMSLRRIGDGICGVFLQQAPIAGTMRHEWGLSRDCRRLTPRPEKQAS